jgi:hypothetical protein
MDNIHGPFFYLKYYVSETGLCLRLQVAPTQVGPIEGASPSLRTNLSSFHLKTETESSTRKAVF